MPQLKKLYPFTAIIGQEEMKTALVLNAVDPAIGGVLIRGQKGTGKTTAVRAIAEVLPEIDVVEGCPFHSSPDNPDSMSEECREKFLNGEKLARARCHTPLVELPLNATEDRLVGALHIEETLRAGKRKFEPGLLASANRGILYVDEVNLLEDHLVDMLLDVSASGVNIVEREGISFSHPSRFILIGTMNPEEGTLRPQFLDRFGLCVTVTGVKSLSQRQKIIRQRLLFEENPGSFIESYSTEQEILAKQIVYARYNLPAVQISDDIFAMAARIAIHLNVHGHRADITMVKTARALASFLECHDIRPAHVMQAAHFVLPHRLEEGPLETYESLHKRIDKALNYLYPNLFVPNGTGNMEENGETETESSEENVSQNVESADGQFMLDPLETMEVPGNTAASSMMLFTFLKKKARKESLNRTK